MRRTAGLLGLALMTACSATSTALPGVTPTPAPSPLVTRTLRPHVTVKPSPKPVWVVGASPLPLRADGFGEVLPTPLVLRNRSLQARDVLPPPADGRFHSTVSVITPALRVRMGVTYKSGCPVPLTSLRYLTLGFKGFDGHVHTGELIVNVTAVQKTINAFAQLFAIDFPIEQMELPGTTDVNAKPTGDGNDTASFVCRTARQQTRFSAHAYDLAIDVNPFQNPYVKGDLVLPELASAYTDRPWKRRGMFLPGSAAVRAFTSQGFTWGGTFHRPKDYQHMSLTGT